MERIFRNVSAPMGLWEQTVCEIRAEIKSWDVPEQTTQYALDLCDKLEHSMCAACGDKYKILYKIGE